jgi:hypothetical protein
MSDVQRTVEILRVQADFLAQHRTLLDSVSYESAIKAWREAHPDRDEYDTPVEEDEPLLYAEVYASYGVSIRVRGPEAGAKELTRTIRRAIGGEWKKSAYGETFRLIQVLSEQPYCSVEITVARDAVCVAVVTGRTEKVIPAVEASPERTEMVDVIDWDCGNLLTDDEPVGV